MKAVISKKTQIFCKFCKIFKEISRNRHESIRNHQVFASFDEFCRKGTKLWNKIFVTFCIEIATN
jgi:hypothetical protein